MFSHLSFIVQSLEAKINDLEARAKSFQMKASQAEERADRLEGQLASAKKAADEAEKNLEKAMRDVQAARAEVRKEAERADALEDQVLAKHKVCCLKKFFFHHGFYNQFFYLAGAYDVEELPDPLNILVPRKRKKKVNSFPKKFYKRKKERKKALSQS